MDEAIVSRLDQLKKDIVDAIEEVGAALDSDEEQRELAAGRMVAALVQRYQALLAELSDADRAVVAREFERRVVDLRRQAAALSHRDSGVAVARSADAGAVPFLERRAPNKSIEVRAIPDRNAPRFSVGRDAEAWCGKCGGLRNHRIVAMVDGLPKQVICDSCGSKHGYRTSSARKNPAASDKPPVTVAEKQQLTADQRELVRRRQQREALIKELNAAEAKRFDPLVRYHQGEVIEHPEHGRGKIENVLRGSILVRFVEGIRPLNTR